MKLVNQTIALDIIDCLVDKCGISLHTQVGSKEFLGKLINLLKSRDSPQIQVKILGLIKKWGNKFESSSDILPNFLQIYKSLSSNGVNFPSNFSSNYNKYLKSGSTTKITEFKDCSNNPVSSNYEKDKDLSIEPVKLNSKNFKSKFKKFIDEMNIVIENIQLANQIIDASSIGEQIDDSLRTIMLNLKNCEDSLIKAIQTQISDEAVLAECFKLNDDLNTTRERYNMLKSNCQPNKFVSTFGWTTFNEIKDDSINNNKLNSNKMPNKEEINKVIQPSEDIFGFFESETVANNIKDNDNNTISNSTNQNNDFDPFSFIVNNNQTSSNVNIVDFSNNNNNNNNITNTITNISNNNINSNNSKLNDLDALLNSAYSNTNTNNNAYNINNNTSNNFDNNLFPSHSSVMNFNNNSDMNNLNFNYNNNNTNLNNNRHNMYNWNSNSNSNSNIDMNINSNQINNIGYPNLSVSSNYNSSYSFNTNNNNYNPNANNNMDFNNNYNNNLSNNIVINKGSFNKSSNNLQYDYSYSNEINKPKDKLHDLNPFAKN